jgi:YD repeat-containing protein
MTVTGQPVVNYNYDANSHLTGISTVHPQLDTLNFDIDYDAVWRRASLSLPNGVTTNYYYENASRLLNLEHLNLAQEVIESP